MTCLPGSLTGLKALPFSNAFDKSDFGAQQQAISTQVDRDICIVIDRSGSMAFGVNETSTGTPPSAPSGWDWCDAVPPNSRWDAAVQGVQAFLLKLQDTPQIEFVGLVSYSTTSTIEVDLTTDYNAVLTAMNDITNGFCGGSTAIGLGVQDGKAVLVDRGFGRSWVAKSMVVLTDGIHNTGVDPLDVVDDAVQAKITVHTLTFSDEADQTHMGTLATDGKGQHWHAPTGTDLINAFREIADNNPTLLTE